MHVTAIGCGLHKSDTGLIHRMVKSLLKIDSHNVTIIDVLSYQPEIDREDLVLVYGARAHKQLMANMSEDEAPQIVLLPDVTKLKRTTANKETRKKAMDILQHVKRRLEGEVLEESDSRTPGSFDVATVKVTLKSGQKIVVSGDQSADALPQEIKSFLELLGKLPYEEVDIEFTKNGRIPPT